MKPVVIKAMEPRNVSTFCNGSISENMVRTWRVPISTHQILSLICLLGIPGNLFVAAVYIRKMTTSIRTYMFALSIADTAICVCFTILVNVRFDKIGIFFFVTVFNATLIFSTDLLAFFATERCLAVAKPHKFTISTRRAKSALAIIAAVSVCQSATISVPLLLGFIRFFTIFSTAIVNVCFVIIVTSYTIMAVLLIKRMRKAHRQINVIATTRSSAEAVATTSTMSTSYGRSAGPRPLNELINVVATTRSNAEAVATTSPMPTSYGPSAGAMPLNELQAQRGTLVLFAVTAVFILCWLPFFLKHYGLAIPDDVRRVYTINSVVNPFIYSFVSPMFRSDVRQFYRDIRARLTVCR